MVGVRLGRYLPLAALLGSLGIARMAHAWLGPLDVQAAAHLPVLCPLRRIMGVPCPTCGLGRSLLATWSGDLAGGFQHHPLGPLLLAAAVLFCMGFALRPGLTTGTLRALTAKLAARPGLAAALMTAYVIWGFAR